MRRLLNKRHVSRALDSVGQIAGCPNRGLYLARGRTGIRLDGLTWDALCSIAAREGITVHRLCDQIDAEKPCALSLTVAVRCYVLSYFMNGGP